MQPSIPSDGFFVSSYTPGSKNELRETLQRQGRDWVRKHHTWDQTTAVYREIYARAQMAQQ